MNSLVSSSSVGAVISDPTRFVPRGHCAKTLIQWLVSSYNIVACPYMPHVYITILKKVVYTLAATSARSGSSLLPSGTLYQFLGLLTKVKKLPLDPSLTLTKLPSLDQDPVHS